MKTKHLHTLIICFLLIGNLAYSQPKNDTVSGSSPFLFPQFTEGTIVFKDGSSNRGMFNYDTSLDEIQFIGPNKEILALAQPEKVAMINIGNRRFMNAKNSFIEILIEGPVSLCLKIHQRRIAEKIGAYGSASGTTSIDTYSSYKTEGRYVNLSPNEAVSYKKEYSFYLLQNDKMKLIVAKNDLLKYFSSNKELLKQEMERQYTKFNDIDSIKKIISWINANGISK